MGILPKRNSGKNDKSKGLHDLVERKKKQSNDGFTKQKMSQSCFSMKHVFKGFDGRTNESTLTSNRFIDNIYKTENNIES